MIATRWEWGRGGREVSSQLPEGTQGLFSLASPQPHSALPLCRAAEGPG